MRLHCHGCGAGHESQPTYPIQCICGSLWSFDPEPYLNRQDPVRPLWQDSRDEAVWWKREDLNPTGSFKDRGAETLMEAADEAGATSLVLDSSGSAALAAARVAAQAGLPLTLHTPENLSPIKVSAIRSFGAKLVAKGDRSDAALRAKQESESFFFSHVYHPAFRGGTMQSGLEVLHQTGSKEATRWIVPVGNGSLLLGLLAALRVHKRTDIEVIAVQASACAGLLRPGQCAPSRASGIAIATPPRRDEMLAGLEALGGHIQEATEDELQAAENRLAQMGILAEPASAACEVVVERLSEEGSRRPTVAWLTGSGDRV